MRARGLLGTVALSAVLVAGPARATPVPPPGPAAAAPSATATSAARLSLSAAPVFGTDASSGDGWLEIVARIEGTGRVPVQGTLEVQSTYGGYYAVSSESVFVAHAPFRVQPRAEAVLRVPVRGNAYSAPTITVAARSDDGTKLAETTVATSSVGPLLVDADTPSRVSVVLRHWPLTLSWSAQPSYVTPPPAELSVGSPASDETTGDALLPERAAGYAAATVVLLSSERLAALHGAELDALVGWVLAGGTLAVFPTRPEDLRAGTLTTFAGGPIATTAPPPVMLTLPGALRPGGPPPAPLPSPPPSIVPPSPAPADAGVATPIAWLVPARTTPVAPSPRVGPSPQLRSRLVGYSGGSLRDAGYGATAAYGLGQVHVLGFDPTQAPALEDPWTHARLLEMVTDAWDRRAVLVFPHGAGQRSSNLYEVRRALDPNENFRAPLGISAILLVLYSIVAGPLVFLRARRRGRPLYPLVWAPVASSVCFATVVVVGLAGKGWSGRARHLALVEAGAGMARGTVKRYRGFFSSQSRAMRVRSSEPTSVLELVTTDAHDTDVPILRFDKDGASLENLTSLPWQTVVVGEDGFSDIGAGVAVRQKADGSVVAINRTGRELRNVIVWAPRAGASWFASVADGGTVVSTAGRSVLPLSSRPATTAGTRTVHPLDMSTVLRTIDHSGDAIAEWSAIGTACGSATDWWPDDVPVLLAEIAGGEGAKSDSGLRVESDVLLLRVVGDGGRT
jgi:hypothetical protein